MTPRQIELLSTLDVNKLNGTIQNLLMNTNLASTPFGDVCFSLLRQTLQEKEQLMKENKKYAKVLKDNGLYTSELILGD